MSKLIAITYPNEETAKEVMLELSNLQKGNIIDLEDAVYITKDKKGKIKVHQSHNLAGAGALGGGFWGMLIGMLFFMPFLGLALGAATGALAGGLSDVGIDDNFMKSLAEKMTVGSSTVFMLASTTAPDKVKTALGKYGGEITYTNLTEEQEEHLRQITQRKTNGKAKMEAEEEVQPTTTRH